MERRHTRNFTSVFLPTGNVETLMQFNSETRKFTNMPCFRQLYTDPMQIFINSQCTPLTLRPTSAVCKNSIKNGNLRPTTAFNKNGLQTTQISQTFDNSQIKGKSILQNNAHQIKHMRNKTVSSNFYQTTDFKAEYQKRAKSIFDKRALYRIAMSKKQNSNPFKQKLSINCKSTTFQTPPNLNKSTINNNSIIHPKYSDNLMNFSYAIRPYAAKSRKMHIGKKFTKICRIQKMPIYNTSHRDKFKICRNIQKEASTQYEEEKTQENLTSKFSLNIKIPQYLQRQRTISFDKVLMSPVKIKQIEILKNTKN